MALSCTSKKKVQLEGEEEGATAAPEAGGAEAAVGAGGAAAAAVEGAEGVQDPMAAAVVERVAHFLDVEEGVAGAVEAAVLGAGEEGVRGSCTSH